MFRVQFQTPPQQPKIHLFLAVLVLACCEWLTPTNAEPYGFSSSQTAASDDVRNNFLSSSSSSFGTVSATAQVSSNSFAGLTQDQIDGQLSGLRTGDMININNVRYMALRTEDDPARRDTIILVQIAGQSDESLNVHNSDSYSAAISHLKDVPTFDESTVRLGQSYNAPSTINNNNNREIIAEGAPSGSSYSAPYSPDAINRQSLQSSAVVASGNGVAGVNDPSSLSSSSSSSSSSSYSSQQLMANVASNRQSSDAGRDHSSSHSYYSPSAAASSAIRIRPNQNPANDVGYENLYSDSIPGVAGQDYPILDKVGVTSFSCNDRKDGGYYADIKSSCQVYHICALRKKFSFLCPNGTIFDQRVFVCNWWYNVDCASSANYYNLNDLIGISPPTQQQAVKNSINFPFSSYAVGPSAPTKLVVQQQQQQPPQQQSIVSQKPLKQIYGPPPSYSQGPAAAVLQPVLIEEAIKRPSNGLKAPLIQTLASSAY